MEISPLAISCSCWIGGLGFDPLYRMWTSFPPEHHQWDETLTWQDGPLFAENQRFLSIVFFWVFKLLMTIHLFICKARLSTVKGKDKKVCYERWPWEADMSHYRTWRPVCDVPLGPAPCNTKEGTSGEGGFSAAFWTLPSLCLTEDLQNKEQGFPKLTWPYNLFSFSFKASRLTASGRPAHCPLWVAQVSVVKLDRHHWHVLLPSRQVNLCFDQFVYKLADQIFAYYKAMAGR